MSRRLPLHDLRRNGMASGALHSDDLAAPSPTLGLGGLAFWFVLYVRPSKPRSLEDTQRSLDIAAGL